MDDYIVRVLNMLTNAVNAGSMMYVIYLLQKITRKESNVYNISTASS